MIDPYLIRSRLFFALGVPASLCPVLHAWAMIENRKFCHDLMGSLLCMVGSANAIRTGVGRKLDALALFSKSSGYDLGSIQRGGGKGKKVTFYGVFKLGRAVLWIQERLVSDPDTSNPIVAIDRYASEAIALHIPKTEKPIQKKKKRRTLRGRERDVDRHTLGYKNETNLPEGNTLRFALEMARLGFPVFPAHRAIEGGCSCAKGSECPSPGKHPCIARWQQVATCYEPSLARLWEKFPFANIGIATGRWMPRLGGYLTVIDCDHRSFGHGSISHLERNELCPLPATREHSNGGGPHKFYIYPRGFHSRPGALGQGIDIQSFGKFVIAPGSVHKSGRVYEVTVDLPIARLPNEWADRIDAIRNKALPLIPEGQRRAKLLAWAGGMVHSGMDPDLILETLRDRRDRRCAKGTHSFSEDDLKEMIAYCQRQEDQNRKERAA